LVTAATGSPLAAGDFDDVAGAEIVDRDDAADRSPAPLTAESPIKSAW